MAQFEIVELTPEGIVPLSMLGKFPTGQSAATSVKTLSEQYPERKFQPRPCADDNDWRTREINRFATGEYEPVPWALPPIPDHFAHRAKKTKENVAFVPTEKHGMEDRQTSVHVNSYLHRYYPHLTVEERRKFVREYTGFDPSEHLHFAESAYEIATVYEDGPGSCMAGPATGFAEEWHPTSSYFGFGLTVAYLKKGHSITARCVVHLERKIWARMYGDGAELKDALEAKGYRDGKWEGDWQGVEMTAKHVDGEWKDDDDEWQEAEGYAVPYLDFASRARLSDDGTRFIIDRCGKYGMQNTDGIAAEAHSNWANHCRVCDKNQFGDRYAYIHEGKHIYACANCVAEKYGYCAATGYVLQEDQPSVTLHDGRKARLDRNLVTQCDVTKQWFLNEECTYHLNAYRTPAEMREYHQKAA